MLQLFTLGAHFTLFVRRSFLQLAETRSPPLKFVFKNFLLIGPDHRVNDGRGFVFISHIGKVYPSGFLPIEGGDLHTDTLAHIYQESPIFVQLRDSGLLHGKCGACEYRNICGGSRARAYAVTGDIMAEEPCCIYQPRGYHPDPNDKEASPQCAAHDLIQLEVAHS